MSESRLIHERNHFSPGVMVLVAVGKKGKSLLIFVDPNVKVTAQYYRDRVLSVTLPELANLSEGDYTFQQDGARANTVRETVTYLREHVPDLLEPSLWPTNSPNLNPVDYTIWSALEENVYKDRRIGSVAELKDILINEWNAFPQQTINRSVDTYRKRLH